MGPEVTEVFEATKEHTATATPLAVAVPTAFDLLLGLAPTAVGQVFADVHPPGTS